MSRAPYFDSGRLPALKSSYDEPRLSHRELVPVHPVHRIDYLEEKIAAQVSNVFIFFIGQESVHLGSSNADHSHQCTIN